MKRTTAFFMSVLLVGVMFVSPATAGDRSRHRWQGVAIGAASMLLLNRLISTPPAYGQPACRPAAGYTSVAPSPGHYEKRWIPQQRWRRFWVPGHYDGYGRYIEGHYVQDYVDNGYWENVWVPGY